MAKRKYNIVGIHRNGSHFLTLRVAKYTRFNRVRSIVLAMLDRTGYIRLPGLEISYKEKKERVS